MKSFSLIRTNVGLTTNVKIVVSSDYSLHLESFDSTTELSQSRFKGFGFNRNSFYHQLLPVFFKDTPADIAFKIKYDDDNDNFYEDFNNQYDDIYQMGCGNVEDNLNYVEEFECLAPLYLGDDFPSNFIIFRVDGPGLIDVNSSNFKLEIIDKLKCISVFDMSNKTPLGEFIEKSFTKNDSYPKSPLYLDVRRLETSRWNGIEYENGGFVSKTFFMDDFLEKEKTYFNFDRFIFDTYRRNKIIFPNILNFKFLFDDTPATKTSLRKWSANRYYGFYANQLKEVFSGSLYRPAILKSNLIVVDNIFYTEVDGENILVDPILTGWLDSITYYIEYQGKFYRLTRFLDGNTYVYKIVTDIPLSTPEDDPLTPGNEKKYANDIFNKNIITINESDNTISFLSPYNTDTFTLDDYEKADVWLIQIDNKYHVLKRDVNNKIYIQTDYGFKQSNNILTYYINDPDPKYRTVVNMAEKISADTLPPYVKIFKVDFTDVKDFDTSIVETKYSHFEYDKKDEVIHTDEPKMYAHDIKSNEIPKPFEQFIVNGILQLIPVSSEYVATSEIFNIENDTLTDLWRKNPVYCKWGYKNSISNNDYPYRINNNLTGDEFNRTVNFIDLTPHRQERNLDYFYSINPDSNIYLNHSLHITDINIMSASPSTYESGKFDINAYFNVIDEPNGLTYSGNYFDYIFGKDEYLDSNEIKRHTNKYSYFNAGDQVAPNSTVFKGLKFNIYDMVNVTPDPNTGTYNFTTRTSNNYNNWKFSILFSESDKDPSAGFTGAPGSPFEIDSFDMSAFEYSAFTLNKASNNDLQWKIIDDWKMGKTYSVANNTDLVLYNDVVYKINSPATQSYVSDPNSTPESLTASWTSNISFQTIYWNPNIAINSMSITASTPPSYDSSKYNFNDIVYRDGEYYVCQGPFTYTPSSITVIRYFDFWKPNYLYQEAYGTASTENYKKYVIYKNKYYRCKARGFTGSGSPMGTYTNPTDTVNWMPFDTVWQENYVSGFTNSTIAVGTTGYDNGDVVRYIDKDNQKDYGYVISLGSGNSLKPDPSRFYDSSAPWQALENVIYPLWKVVEHWNPNDTYSLYSGDTYTLTNRTNCTVVFEDIVYGSLINDNINNNPKLKTTAWLPLYSLIQDTDYVYGTFSSRSTYVAQNPVSLTASNGNVGNGNSVVNMNGTHYLCTSNTSFNTLDNGINIYINKKWEHILISIYVNDNTYNVNGKSLMYDTNRDDLYSELTSKLTAKNFMSAINDLTNKYGFSDYINYYIIEKDGKTFKKYNYDNITRLPVIISCEPPDELILKNVRSNMELQSPNKNIINVNAKLKFNEIDSLSKLNYYNDGPLGVKISDNDNDINIVDNIHGLKNNNYIPIYRFSGEYMPIFYEIELFKRADFNNDDVGNFTFDPTLTNFGIVNEKIFSKVGKENLLKLRNLENEKSIYPMIDEFGYSFGNYFIFKSNWDQKYYIRVS